MSLSPGTRLGPYELIAQIGAGGMGEVYRARDTSLKRDVALKILPESFAADSERLARFQREAEVLASLNHPNIAGIYGLAQADGSKALVMELVEGEDLAERIARGPIPVDEALPIAKQIAEALEVAHDQGIIHRDLKPANIKVRPDGTVKVLDFGLAKALEPMAALSPSGAHSATITSPAMVTRLGVILGTAAYMAPEQAKGRAVDRRTDIWAFGCVLFEMFTGRPSFRGDTVTETLASVLTREPAWEALPQATPDGVRRLMMRCLQKDPKRRLHDIADARIELEDATAAPPAPASPPPRRSRLNARLAAGLALASLAALATVLTWGARLREAAPREVRVNRLTDLPGLEESPALSPDGRSVAFTAGKDGTRQIFVQLVAGGAPLQLTHDSMDHQSPRWAPDSSSLVYFSPALPGAAEGTIWEIPALGGATRRIVNALGGVDVNPADRRLAFFRLFNQKIQLVTAPPDGSSTQVVYEFQPDRYYLYPRWSPDGQWIAFQRGDSVRFDLFVVPSRGGELRQLTRENVMMGGLAWLPDSAGLLFSSSRGNTMPYLPALGLWQVTLSNGRVRQIASDETSYLMPDVSRTGTIVATRMRLQTDIWKFPADGPAAENVSRGIRITRQTGHVLTPTVGRDEREIAFLSDSGGHANLWVVNTETHERRPITHERDPDVAVGVPVWSPDGSAIAFVYSRGNPGLGFGVWLVNPDGSNLRRLANPALGPAWSHDGRWVYYSTRGGPSDADVVLRKIPATDGSAVTVRTEALRNVIGSDGATLYYVIERPLVDGTPEFEIRAAAPEDGPSRVLARIPPTRVPIWQIVNPALSPDGRWLAQALTDGFTTNVWALSTSTGQWRQITDFGDRPTFIARRVSWSSDGRFVLAALGEGDADILLMDGLLPREGS